MRQWWQQLSALAGLAAAYFKPVGPETFPAFIRQIRKRFPSVRQMTTQELSEWLADSSRLPHPLLIDVRPEAEFAVSHLQGARRFTTVNAVKAALKEPAQPVVVYCSVGYRSSAVAEKLRRAGLVHVWNLEGSIFAWANEGRPVYRGETPLDPPQVHPYNAKWGQLLKPELK